MMLMLAVYSNILMIDYDLKKSIILFLILVVLWHYLSTNNDIFNDFQKPCEYLGWRIIGERHNNKPVL